VPCHFNTESPASAAEAQGPRSKFQFPVSGLNFLVSSF